MDQEPANSEELGVKSFNFDEFCFRYRYLIFFILLGAILIGFGVFSSKNPLSNNQNKVEVLNATTEGQDNHKRIVVEISGAVEKPGVYKVSLNSRVDEVLVLAGGLSGSADRVWVEKNLNRAAKVIDGQKIYIPTKTETSNYQTNVLSAKNDGDDQTISTNFGGEVGVLVNINTATLKDLDSLPGIGQVYGQNIIDHRPYSKVEDLLTKGVLKTNVYEKIKDKITVY